MSGNIDLTAQASVPLTATLTNTTIKASADFDLDFGLDADLRAFDLFDLTYQYNVPTIALPLYSKSYTIGGSSGGTGTTGGNGGPGGSGSTGGNGGPGGAGSTGGTGSTAPGQLLIKNGTTTSFGNVPVNTTASINLPFVNSGTVSITISSITTSAPFSISPASATVPANGSTNLVLSFTPTSAGDFNASITINSNAADPTISYETSGTGTQGSNSGSGGSSGSGTSGGSGATAVPGIGSYTDCLAVTPNAGCPSFTDGVIHAQVVAVNEANHTITFEVANCNASAFSSPSTLYVYKGLCGGSEVGGVSFPATVYTYQITVSEPDMTGTKSYNIIVQQTNGNQFISYDARAISITF